MIQVNYNGTEVNYKTDLIFFLQDMYQKYVIQFGDTTQIAIAPATQKS